MTLPISSSVFLDGELITAEALYIRVWTAINSLNSLINANSIQRGTVSVNMGGTSAATNSVTFPSPYFSATPQILLNPRYGSSINYMTGKTAQSLTGFTVRCATASGTSSETVVIDWVSIGS